jgi:hypothetical protein
MLAASLGLVLICVGIGGFGQGRHAGDRVHPDHRRRPDEHDAPKNKAAAEQRAAQKAATQGI